MMKVKRWFRSISSPGYLQSDVPGEGTFVLRGWWAQDDGEQVVTCVRLSQGPGGPYWYVALHWETRGIIATAFAGTDRDAQAALAFDLEARGWLFSDEPDEEPEDTNGKLVAEFDPEAYNLIGTVKLSQAQVGDVFIGTQNGKPYLVTSIEGEVGLTAFDLVLGKVSSPWRYYETKKLYRLKEVAAS